MRAQSEEIITAGGGMRHQMRSLELESINALFSS